MESYAKLEAKLDTGFADMTAKLEEQRQTIAECERRIGDVEETQKREMKQNKVNIKNLERKIMQLEGELHRNNLVFFGVPLRLDFHDNTEDTEKMIKTCIKETLGIGFCEIEAAYRLIPSGSRLAISSRTPPILVKFVKQKDRTVVLSRTKRLAGTGISIAFDLPPQQQIARNKLNERRKEEIAKGSTAFFKRNQLIIDGATYDWDFEDEEIRCVGKQKISTLQQGSTQVVATLVQETMAKQKTSAIEGVSGKSSEGESEILTRSPYFTTESVAIIRRHTGRGNSGSGASPGLLEEEDDGGRVTRSKTSKDPKPQRRR